MNKSVLIFSASPRKNGNSNKLCDSFTKGAEEKGCNVERIYLCDKNIKYCTGEKSCQRFGEECVIDDDMQNLYPQILSADIIVIATPIYFFNFSGQMKTFMDRMYPLVNKMEKKIFYLLASASSPNEDYLKGVLTCYDSFVGSFPRNNKSGGYVFAYGTSLPNDVTAEDLTKAYELGKTIE